MSSSEATLQQSGQVANPGHRKHPCVLCQQRKVKCDRSEPCGNCKKAGINCVSATTLPPRKRKRRFPEAELLARLRRYEQLLRGYGADIDAINSESGIPIHPDSTSIKSSHSDSRRHDHVTSLSPEPSTVRSLSVRRSLRHVDNNLSLGVNEEFRDAEDILQGSSEDEMFANPITKTYEELGSHGGDPIFGPQQFDNLQSLHPSPLHIFRLWQTFLDNVNPLTKIFHAPTVQQKVLDATAELDDIPKNIEALMFGIYAAATISMRDEDCQKLFGEDKPDTLARFQSGARQALINAGYLRSSDLVVLQAFVLYLLSSLQMTIDPRSLFCLTGIAVRIAQRMGLSSDGTSYALPPFEVEMRRRLWWQIILIDNRVAELSGAGPSLLTYAWNTKLPSNVNDSDLFADMRDPPVERPGFTEMIFVRIRCEIAGFVQESRALSGSVNIKDEVIDEFEARIEQEYLKYCDPLVPLHLMTTMMTRSALCKLRMGQRQPQFISDRTNNLPQHEKDKLFQLSLRMLENHNTVMESKVLSRYIWHVYTNFPFPAHVYLLCALRYRTLGEFADRAWQQLSHSHEHRRNHGSTIAKKKDSFLHFALGNLTIKAWEAREAALQPFNQVLPTPPFVSRYREQLASRKSQKLVKDDQAADGLTGAVFGETFGASFPEFNPNVATMGENFDQQMVPGLFPNDMSPSGWDFWNDMMGGGAMHGLENGSSHNFYQS